MAEVAPYLRAHASSLGVEGPSLGTMEPENQHVYQSRLSSVSCAWTRRGADAVARIRSRRASGRAIPRRGRAERVPTRALARRQARVERSLAKAGPTESQVVQSEGRGWEFPAQASTSGMRADVRYESGLTADRKLGYPQ